MLLINIETTRRLTSFFVQLRVLFFYHYSEVYNLTIPDFIGRLSRDINPGPLASGVYYLKIRHNKKAYSKKLVIAQ